MNSFLCEDNEAETQCESVIGCSQVLAHSLSELSTVYTSFKRSIAMANQIGQPDVVVVCDLAIYAKAVEIINKKENELGRIVLRLRAFHLACSFLGIIGKRFRYEGMEDILIESDVIAAGLVNGVLEGKHYNRGIYMHKLAMAALFHIKWKKFGQWLTEQENLPAYTPLHDDIKNIQQDVTRASYDRKMNNIKRMF